MKINIENVIKYTDIDKKERTKNRLKEIIDLGMIDVNTTDQYGVTGIHSGLYIEMVWSHSEEDWKSYIDWVKSLVKERLEELCAITKRPMEHTVNIFALCDHDFYKLIKLEENLNSLNLSNNPSTKEEVERALKLEPAHKSFKLDYHFGKLSRVYNETDTKNKA